jgi:hypothetical protein
MRRCRFLSYAEYIALHEASHEVTFLHQLLSGLELLDPGPTTLYSDNDVASLVPLHLLGFFVLTHLWAWL